MVVAGCCITQFTLVACRGYGGFGALGHYVYHRELLPRKVNGPWEGKIAHIATQHDTFVTTTREESAPVPESSV